MHALCGQSKGGVQQKSSFVVLRPNISFDLLRLRAHENCFIDDVPVQLWREGSEQKKTPEHSGRFRWR